MCAPFSHAVSFPLKVKSESRSSSVLSDSLRPHGLYSPWNSPGQNTGVGSLSLLQGIILTQGSNPGLPHCRQILYQLLLLSHFSCVWLCVTPPGSPVPGILQARTLEWVAISFSNAWKWKWSRSVVSDPQRPHGLQPSRLLHPWDFPGKSTGVGCHCLLHLPAEAQGKPKNTEVGSLTLLQQIFLTQELNVGLLHCRRILYQGSPHFHWEYGNFLNLVLILALPSWPKSHGLLTLEYSDGGQTPDFIFLTMSTITYHVLQVVLMKTLSFLTWGAENSILLLPIKDLCLKAQNSH